MVWRMEDPQGNEAGKIRWEIVEYTRGRGLDLGCGPSKAFQHFIGVDNYKDTKLFGIQMRPDVVADCTTLEMFADESMDFVFSSHLLEHVEDFEGALKVWFAKVRVGGYLVLYLPHRDLYPRIGTPGSNPDHKHDFCETDIIDAMERVGTRALGPQGFDLLVNERRSEGQEYSFLQVYQKIRGAKTRFSCMNPKPDGRTACVVRYGGYGDMLQAAAILPELKRQGYHVTMMTTPKGQEVLRHDPSINAWFIQDEGQVPNHELNEFWGVVSKRFDKFVNLCESIEGTLLAMPGRANHAWPWEVRQATMNVNYAEWTAQLAGVEFREEGRFYASHDEVDAAVAYLEAIGFADKYLILYALSGSSRHKFYPGQDVVMTEVLRHCPDACFILVGDEACKILEVGWEDHDRVATESGEFPIRSTLTLASICNAVLGPETGVLNSVAYDSSIFKVCLLSHSSVENLTKHWHNCVPVVPQGVKCYPCHQLHYTGEFCPQDEQSGAAICQASIDPSRIIKPILHDYEAWTKKGGAVREAA